MRYQHRVRINTPLYKVYDFFRHSSNLVEITPTFLPIRIEHAPETINEGDEMSFTFRLVGFPIKWVVRVEQFNAQGFTDRQIRGPFLNWSHRHQFNSIDEQVTEIYDLIEFALRPHPIWAPLGLMMAVGLPFLFAYRGRKTKQLLED
jgi:ligand-binding SRPBCC domain-containing protein